MNKLLSVFSLVSLAFFSAHCSDGGGTAQRYESTKSAAEEGKTGDGAGDGQTTVPEGGNATPPAAEDPKALAFQGIRDISKKYCDDCHIDDGFEKLRTWTDLKGKAITRLTIANTEEGAMPPIDTTIGKSMPAEEKAKIVAWLQTQKQTVAGEIGEVEEPVADEKISGELKLVADVYCVSCHGNDKAYWVENKANAIQQINSGKMPRGKTMSEADKQKLLNALNAL